MKPLYVKQRTFNRGMTIIEVLIAIVVLSLTMTLLSGAIVSSMRSDRQSGQRTQAAQVLNAVGRQVVEGDPDVIPALGTGSTAWDYGELKDTFTEMADRGDFADPDAYRVTVERADTAITLAGVTAIQYDVEVCWRGAEGETCIAGVTAGPASAQKFIGN